MPSLSALCSGPPNIQQKKNKAMNKLFYCDTCGEIIDPLDLQATEEGVHLHCETSGVDSRLPPHEFRGAENIKVSEWGIHPKK